LATFLCGTYHNETLIKNEAISNAVGPLIYIFCQGTSKTKILDRTYYETGRQEMEEEEEEEEKKKGNNK
jgi:hypothetical protein